MKKITFSAIALFACTSIFAGRNTSTDHRETLLFGVKAGANYSNVYNTRGEAFVADPKFGLALGAFAAIPLGELIGIQPELLLSQKGFKGSGALLGTSYGLTRTTTFIDLPIFFSLKPVPFVTLLAGPQFSYLVHQKDVFTSSATSYQQEQEFKNDNVRKNILCFVLGTDIGMEEMVFGLRAGWDFQSNHGDGTSSTPNYKNVWYQATFGYRFL